MTMQRLIRTGAALAALAVLATTCGSDDDEPAAEATTTTTAAAETTTTADMHLVADEYDIGDGRTLFLRCRGVGSPTILFEAGDEDDSQTWTGILSPLEEETRTCAYDRAGTGRSSPATGCRGLDDIIGDLEKLLDVAGIDGPYLFVGSSGGGYLAAEMAARHASETVGLVTIDTFKAITSYPPGLLEEIKCDAPHNVEHRDYYGVEHGAWDDRVQIGDFPLTVITNDYGDAAEYDEIGNVLDQQGWFALTPNHKQVVVTSGHDVAGNEPDLIVTEVLAILEAARAG
jgi:pimeloyl-ACP methyl ester carboxylesterase